MTTPTLPAVLALAEKRGVKLLPEKFNEYPQVSLNFLYEDAIYLSISAHLAENGVAVVMTEPGSWWLLWHNEQINIAATDYRSALLLAAERFFGGGGK